MNTGSPRRWLGIAGWLVAVVLLILYVASKYQITIVQREPSKEAQRSAEPSRSPTTSQELAKQTSGRPTRSETRELSPSEIYQQASPSVVLIEVFDDEGHKRGLGSGFLISQSGVVITNYHVIQGAHQAKVRFGDGVSYDADGVVGYDSDRDVAAIKIDQTDKPNLPLGDPDTLKEGERVIAIGSPLGLQNTVTEGIVSARREGIIQMSVPISPGSSGGPVFNMKGQVIGIAVASLIGGQNLNFAVPITFANRFLHGQLKASLADVVKANTVVERILESTISISAGEKRSWPIKVNENQMHNAEIEGSFSSRGGATDNIRVRLLNESLPLYDSGRVTQGTFHHDISKGGSYVFEIDNSESILLARQVTAKILLQYVK